MSNDEFELIVAADKNGGIGNKGTLPWPPIKGDMMFFKKSTTETKHPSQQNAVIMGRKTYLSIPPRFRPLDKRINIVITTNPKLRQEENIPDSVHLVNSFESAITMAFSIPGIARVFVIGGSSVYAEAMKHEKCGSIHYTNIISPEFVCDTFFPKIDDKKFKVTARSAVQEESNASYEFVTFSRTYN